MNNQPSFTLSQGYDVIPPSPGKAYPILCDDWDFLKNKVSEISDQTNVYHTLGTLMLGGALSVLLAILTGAIPSGAVGVWPTTLIVSISCVVVLGLVGAIAMHFSQAQRQVKETLAKDILVQMEIIEKRYGS